MRTIGEIRENVNMLTYKVFSPQNKLLLTTQDENRAKQLATAVQGNYRYYVSEQMRSYVVLCHNNWDIK